MKELENFLPYLAVGDLLFFKKERDLVVVFLRHVQISKWFREENVALSGLHCFPFSLRFAFDFFTSLSKLLGEFPNTPGQEHYGGFPPPLPSLKNIHRLRSFPPPPFSKVAKFGRKMQQIYFNIFNMLPPYGIWTSEGSCRYFRFSLSLPGIVSCLGIPPRGGSTMQGRLKGGLSPAPILQEPK